MIFQEMGLSELRQGAASNSLRSILSTLTLLMFHLYITVILGEKNTATLPPSFILFVVIINGQKIISLPQVSVKETSLRPKLCWSPTLKGSLMWAVFFADSVR